MIIKNEEKHIKQCLENALPLVDEAIIVDTGSTDNTIKIIEEFNSSKIKLCFHEWNNDFAEARNKSLEEATGDWILVLDADEKFIYDKEKLMQELKQNKDKAYFIPMYNFLSAENIVYSAVMIRLFKNMEPKYEGAIHEQITLQTNKVQTATSFDTSICKIIHYGYLPSNVKEKNKTKRNIDIIKSELEKNPDNSFQWYNLGTTYMGQGKFNQAVDAFIKSHNLAKVRKSFHDDLVLRMAKCLWQTKQYKQLKTFLKNLENDRQISQYPDLYYYMGLIHKRNKKYNNAITAFQKAIDIGERKNNISEKGMGSYIPMLEIARILAIHNKIQESVIKYMEAIFSPHNISYFGKKELEKLLIKNNMSNVLEELEKLTKSQRDKNEIKSNNQIAVDEGRRENIKISIKKLIEAGEIIKAKDIIKEYNDVCGNDADFYCFKSVLAMVEGNFIKAIRIINEALLKFPLNGDLLYNKAYSLEMIKDYKDSYKAYKQVLDMTIDENNKEEIANKLIELKKKCRNVDQYGKTLLVIIKEKTTKSVYKYIYRWLDEVGFTIIDSNYTNKKNSKIQGHILLYDLTPENMVLEELEKFPEVDNRRYFLISALEKELKIEFNIENINKYLYLTKNEKEAAEMFKKFFSREIDEFDKKIYEIESNYKTNFPVIKLFNAFRHRAKTELIQYRNGLAVKKTWKPGKEKFLEREKFACGELSKIIPYIPPLLESGENYIIIPYYEDILSKDEETKKRILTTNIIDVADFLRQIYEAGYFNPDIHPGQFVFSKKEGLKAIDFEYLQPYEEKPQLFIKSYDIEGYPIDFKGDKPNYAGRNLHTMYNNLWRKYTGYSLKQIAQLVLNGKYRNDDLQINKVLSLLSYAKTSGQSYDGSLYESAYHSFQLKGYYFRGQREPSLRLQKVPYDFCNKTVLDIGCNAGGMLHFLADKIKVGIGIDYDSRLINAANAIKTINKKNNLSFYRFDLENEELDMIKKLILSNDGKVDICFLLSVCMWIKNWREVIAFVALISNNLLFETNGSKQQQLAQIEELKKHYKDIKMIEEESIDDPGQPNRKLLLCKNEDINKVVIKSNMEDYKKLLSTIIKSEYEVIYKNSKTNDKSCKLYLKGNEFKEIDFKDYLNNFFDVEFYRNYFKLLNNKMHIKGIVTGLSYFETGVNVDELKVPFINMALSSQDLFYDFAMLKYIMEELDTKENIEHVIIGLSNYSFRYDLSLTQNPQTKEKPKIYYPILKRWHNYFNSKDAINEYECFEREFNFILRDDYVLSIFQYFEKSFNSSWNDMLESEFDLKNLSEEIKSREIYLAQRWDQKYLDTVQENIEIFNTMLNYLKDNNIKIIVATNPVTDFYKKYFSKNCRQEFLNIICMFQKEFEFTFIDGYNIDCFENRDFYDASHLNRKGASKFTKILNEYL